MRKTLAVVGILCIILGSLLVIQVIRDGGFALDQSSIKTVTIQNPPSSSNQQSVSSNNNSSNSLTIKDNGSSVNSVISSSGSSGSVANASAILDAQSGVFNHIFKKTEKSVVQITSKLNTIVPNITINGSPLESQSTRLGSGFVYNATKGLIITNNHVVQGSKTVDVTFVGGDTFSANVIGTDAFSDIAVLKITDDFSKEGLVPIPLGNSSQLQVGQHILAIGNPFGLSDSLTNGIVSQVGRLLPNQEMGFSIPDVIQTNASINPGNSGGPLLDIHGNVMGVNSAITSQTGEFSGVGFAIPSNAVARIVPHLIKDGKYDHPWLGIAGINLAPDLSQKLSLPRDSRGVVIASVVTGSPADKAGIIGRVQGGTTPFGDLITAIDGHQVKRIEDIISYVEDFKSAGDKIMITVNRGGQQHNLTVTLEARPIQTAQPGG